MKEGLLLHSIFAASGRARRDQNITILALLSPDRPLTKRMGSQTKLLADTSQKSSCIKVYSSEFFSRTEWRRLLSCRIEDIAGERGHLRNTSINQMGTGCILRHLVYFYLCIAFSRHLIHMVVLRNNELRFCTYFFCN